MRKKSVGILYICTGAYKIFWKDFYLTFERNFLPEVEKYYYVFSDGNDLFGIKGNANIIFKRIEQQPWPLITLLRFHTFLSIEAALQERDFLIFANSNMICEKAVHTKELFNKDRKLFFTYHPGYYKKRPEHFPYERNSKSFAYVPYHKGQKYVIGAFYGGLSGPFLEMCREMKMAVEEDLKKGIIARWHDESHINRFIIGRTDIRVISPSYCYPVGIDIPYERIIAGVSKQDKFDVIKFKGIYHSKHTTANKIFNVLFNPSLLKVRDRVLGRNMNTNLDLMQQ